VSVEALKIIILCRFEELQDLDSFLESLLYFSQGSEFFHRKTTYCNHPWIMHSSYQQRATGLGRSGCAGFKAIPMGCHKKPERSLLEILNLCALLAFITRIQTKTSH